MLILQYLKSLIGIWMDMPPSPFLAFCIRELSISMEIECTLVICGNQACLLKHRRRRYQHPMTHYVYHFTFIFFRLTRRRYLLSQYFLRQCHTDWMRARVILTMIRYCIILVALVTIVLVVSTIFYILLHWYD